MRRSFLLAGAGLLFGGRAMAQSFSEAQRQEIVTILREALRRDPSILRDAFQAIQEAEERERSGAQRAAIAANREALFNDPESPVRGNPRGDVTIVEFFDVRCPYCKRLHGELAGLLRRDRELRIVMKDLPILGPQSVVAARALLAAQRQGKYVELFDALMSVRGEPTDAVIRAAAERLGIDHARMRREMDDPAIQRRIEANIALARALRIEGTPALVIGETLIPGVLPMAQLEQLIAEQRQRRR
ncbi:DsbA family protein [Roseomonas alkaliterrae]|uniref:Protein-disulfide isomerase n=1 Tax=Neoroseomonas alkaliterrae TaxID=1452450 RepID=A0A840XTW9_9PROT|nr:DsbA family protein [Neoroseomonas alkaliterrae]MBB5690460.1 protein-disulfide isomerase [Neoroseomonas alkaliterrae]MBR0678376.1 DsbA family protein [Neoroseomonas alkaliterrae]